MAKSCVIVAKSSGVSEAIAGVEESNGICGHPAGGYAPNELDKLVLCQVIKKKEIG
jgi:hypothetical protein